MGRRNGQPIGFWEVVEEQHGTVTRVQLRRLGLSGDEIDGWIARGFLHEAHRGVFAVGRPELSARGRWMAAVLACGPVAALSHTSAAALWGFFEEDAGDPHVSMPVGCHYRPPRVRDHRRLPMPPVYNRDGIPVVEPLWTLVDIARDLSVGRLERAVNEADKLGLIDLAAAAEAAASLRRRPGVRKLRTVLARHQRTDSGLERRFLRLVREAGLPRPKTQQEVLSFRVDFFWPDLGLVVETDGFRYHRTPAQQARDRLRDQTLTAAGLTPLRFPEDQIKREPKVVAHTLRLVIRRLSNRLST